MNQFRILKTVCKNCKPTNHSSPEDVHVTTEYFQKKILRHTTKIYLYNTFVTVQSWCFYLSLFSTTIVFSKLFSKEALCSPMFCSPLSPQLHCESGSKRAEVKHWTWWNSWILTGHIPNKCCYHVLLVFLPFQDDWNEEDDIHLNNNWKQ